MGSLLPIPIEDHLPEQLRQDISEVGQAFIDKHNKLFSEIEEETIGLENMKSAEKCPVQFLNEFGYMFSADIAASDTSLQKRRKIASAVSRHKQRGLWKADVKKRIDIITGYSAAIFKATDSEDSIEFAGLDFEPDYYWSTERGDDDLDDSLGTWEVGFMTEYVVAGNIYINCHEGITGETLTAEQIAKIIEELKDDVAPSYMILYLCYLDSSGAITVYDNGVIG